MKTKLKKILGGKVAAPAPKKGKKEKKKPGGKSAPKMKKEHLKKKPAKIVTETKTKIK